MDTMTKDKLDDRRARIRDLNDALRRGEELKPDGHSVLFTKGVNALGLPFLMAVTDAIQHFDAFTPDVESRWCALPHC